jgi:hypothetical protein
MGDPAELLLSVRGEARQMVSPDYAIAVVDYVMSTHPAHPLGRLRPGSGADHGEAGQGACQLHGDPLNDSLVIGVGRW